MSEDGLRDGEYLSDLSQDVSHGAMAMLPTRKQIEARRIAKLAYPYPGCCLCGQLVGVELAHLDHSFANNDRDNLAWLCRHHHWMFDIGLFSIEAVKLQRDYWQAARGKRTMRI